ncbi:MAG: symmetrical bis(5'-nucleosyl)-tetraphosphatase [Rhodocyclaceae bacterium]
MSTWVVGDLQGCLEPLERLLAQVAFDRAHDQLWLVGDLVNRGPQSVETLRFVRDLGEAAVVVLGNHDLALLAAAAQLPARPGTVETAHAVLDAPDADVLLDWLRSRRMLHVHLGYAMVHAGLLPQWDIAKAQALASEVEAALRGPDWRTFLLHLFGNSPDAWSDDLTGWDRLRVIVNVMTRMRFVRPDNSMDMRPKGPPDKAPAGVCAWFDVPEPAWRSHTVLCGHWSAVGFRQTDRIVSLDSGCVWGACLTGLCLEDRRVAQVPCPAYQEPGAD